MFKTQKGDRALVFWTNKLHSYLVKKRRKKKAITVNKGGKDEEELRKQEQNQFSVINKKIM